MFLFLSFLVAIAALVMLGDMATSYYPTSSPAAVVTLIIYSFVCIIREVKKEDDIYFDSLNNGYNRGYSSNWKNNAYSGNNSYYNNNAYSYNNVKQTEKVEVFAPDKKEENKDEERPKVLHYPSQKEARNKIAELNKSKWWRGKRNVMAFLGVDITKEFYKPYLKEEIAVKGNNKEDNTRFMPKQTNSNNAGWWQKQETEEYNIVAKRVGRSCDIAFDGETFVEETIN